MSVEPSPENELNIPTDSADIPRSAGEIVDGPTQELEVQEVSSTLVDLGNSIVAVLGDIPAGLGLVPLDFLPAQELTQVHAAVGTIASIATAGSALAQQAQNVQGLFRLTDASAKILAQGGTLAVKDGAHLGTILKAGGGLSQARFVPVTMTGATAIASIGPALAMMAIQMQLTEVAAIASENLQVTKNLAHRIRLGELGDFEGIESSISRDAAEVRELRAVPRTIWERIASRGDTIESHVKKFEKYVRSHSERLSNLEGKELRSYLVATGDTIVADTYVLARALKTLAEYKSLEVMYVHGVAEHDPLEKARFDKLIEETPQQFEKIRSEIRRTVNQLVGELNLIDVLQPGRVIESLKTKGAHKRAKEISSQLLEAVAPIYKMFGGSHTDMEFDGYVGAPEDFDVVTYLRVLEWRLRADESVRALSFAYDKRSAKIGNLSDLALSKQVDLAWEALDASKRAKIKGMVSETSLLVVTNKRMLISETSEFLREGLLNADVSLRDVTQVRVPGAHVGSTRPTITVNTKSQDYSLMFTDETVAGALAEHLELAWKAAQERHSHELSEDHENPTTQQIKA